MLSETAATRYDFPFVSERRKPTKPSGADDITTPEQELVPNDRLRVWAEDLFVATGAGTEHEDTAIGSVAIAHGGGRDRLPFAAVFTFFDGDDMVVVKGDVPREQGDWKGDGTVDVIDGTGRFEGRDGRLPLHSENPKRWG
jgi:hypothetical protein